MPKSPKSSAATVKPKTKSVSLNGVMLFARAIIEQGRTDEFLRQCAQGKYKVRANMEFLEFARDFATEPLSTKPASSKGESAVLTADARKFTEAVSMCNNTFDC